MNNPASKHPSQHTFQPTSQPTSMYGTQSTSQPPLSPAAVNLSALARRRAGSTRPGAARVRPGLRMGR